MYNQTQTVFTLSMFSNLGADLVGDVATIETTLDKRLRQSLLDAAGEIGAWTLEWGPAVYQAQLSGSNLADNVMYVAKRDNPIILEFVIAIAGTNPYSPFDWLIENRIVNPLVRWEYGSPPVDLNPRIAPGIATGLYILQTLQPGPNLKGSGTSILEFIKQELVSNAKITVAGHSLGGALSAALALWLFDTQAQWDPMGYARISCLPSAGPTPGNSDFASYYTNSELGQRTTRIFNSIDVVPNAWAEHDLEKIPSLYEPFIDGASDLDVNTLVNLAIFNSFSGNYAQINSSAIGLPGEVNKNLIDETKTTFENFVIQLDYQHVGAYFDLLGVTGISLPLPFTATDLAKALRAKLQRRREMARQKMEALERLPR